MTAPTNNEHRNRSVKYSVATGLIEAVAGQVVSIARVTAFARLLGKDLYGAYVVIGGITAMCNFASIGLHFAFARELTHARGKGDNRLFAQVVKAGFGMYGAVSAAGLALLALAAMFLPIDSLFGTHVLDRNMLRTTLAFAIGASVLQISVKMGATITIGLQRLYWTSIFRTVSVIANFTACVFILLSSTGAARLSRVVVWGAALDFLSEAVFCASAFLFWRSQNSERRVGWLSPTHLWRLVRESAAYLTTTLATLLKRNSSTLIVSYQMGAGAVPSYSVPFTLSTTGLNVGDVISASLWPALGEAYAQSDWAWIERQFKRCIAVTLLVIGALATLLLTHGTEFIALWLNRVSNPSWLLLALFGMWMMSQILSINAASLLNAIGNTQTVMKVTLVEGILTTALSAVLVIGFKVGIEGAALSMLISGMIGTAALGAISLPWRTLKRVRIPWHYAIRVSLCIALAVFANRIAADHVLHDARPLIRLAIGIPATLALYACASWFIVADDSIRLLIMRRRAARPGATAASASS